MKPHMGKKSKRKKTSFVIKSTRFSKSSQGLNKPELVVLSPSD